MGQSLSSIRGWWNGPPPINIAILGMDDVGKTTILYWMKLGEQVRTVSTSGFNVEKISYKDVSYTLWDMGGADKLRPLQYTHQTKGMEAIIWVVDSTCHDRFPYSKEELDFVLSQEHLRGKSLLVFNAKSDLPNAAPAAEVAKQLGLFELKDREDFFILRLYTNFWFQWCIVTCSSKTGDGIWEGFDKIHESLAGTNKMNSEIQ